MGDGDGGSGGGGTTGATTGPGTGVSSSSGSGGSNGQTTSVGSTSASGGSDATGGGDPGAGGGDGGSGGGTPAVCPETYSNPLIWQDLPDLEVIRVDDTYYYTASTFHHAPGAPCSAPTTWSTGSTFHTPFPCWTSTRRTT